MRNWSCSRPKHLRSNIWLISSSLTLRRYRTGFDLSFSSFLYTVKGSDFKHAKSYFWLLPQDSEYVVAERNFITEDRALLSFHKADIIRLQAMDGLDEGEKKCTRMHTFKSVDLSHNQWCHAWWGEYWNPNTRHGGVQLVPEFKCTKVKRFGVSMFLH